jgi:hypothetical protein
MIKSYCTVKLCFNRPAVFIEGFWFFVHEEVGTKGYFKAHPQDQFAYMVSEDETVVA